MQKPEQLLFTVCTNRLQLMTHRLCADRAAHSLCHPAALQLAAHDAQQGTHYCDILRTYLLQFHNYSLAAKSLFMHRNTLTYHLERIEKILGISLGDPILCLELLLSLMMLETA